MLFKNRGTVNLFVNMYDENSPQRVKLFSRQHRLAIDASLYKHIKRLKQSGILDFQIN